MTNAPSPGRGILFTDQYQLTMAQLYFAEGMHELPARFDYFFRSYPDYGSHRAGYCVFAGLDPLLEWVEHTRARTTDVEYLRSLEGSTGRRTFSDDFLGWFEAAGTFSGLSIDAVAEGRVVHVHEPIVSVEGPFAMAQILETALLNHLNYPTLIATKAARVNDAARGSAVLEFGMRRGPAEGANAGGRAALVGGAHFTSNVDVSRAVGLDPKGTHAHSMVQAFLATGAGELEAFRAYARTYPDDCLLLVDTVDTLESGIPNALTVFDELRSSGHEPVGIRLDSGDLADLAVASARRLDEAGYDTTQIVLSSDLDEHEIASILRRIEAKAGDAGVDFDKVVARLVYGVGTRLITSEGAPALGGVYKLSAVAADGRWRPALKISDTKEKMPIPGRKRLWRVYDESGEARADVVGLESEELRPREALTVHSIYEDEAHRLGASEVAEVEPLSRRVFADGARTEAVADIETLRERRARDVARLAGEVRDLEEPRSYPVLLSGDAKALQQSLFAEMAPAGES